MESLGVTSKEARGCYKSRLLCYKSREIREMKV